MRKEGKKKGEPGKSTRERNKSTIKSLKTKEENHTRAWNLRNCHPLGRQFSAGAPSKRGKKGGEGNTAHSELRIGGWEGVKKKTTTNPLSQGRANPFNQYRSQKKEEKKGGGKRAPQQKGK